MSYRKDLKISKLYREFLASLDKNTSSAHLSYDDLVKLFHEILAEGIYGLGFSLYEEGQKPGDHITEEQVRRRMNILKPHIKAIRSFSCIEGNEFIPRIAKEFGLKTLVGAWIGDDLDKNKQEITALIKLANEGYVDIAAVGNEVLYRNDIPKEELMQYMDEVRAAIPKEIPVTYVDAYYEFSVHPDLTEKCDVILVNCYPFWESCPIEYSLQHMQQMYGQALSAAKGKKVIISETGWPSQGENLGAAQPSAENFLKYFINTQLWCKQANIECYYFSSFDEAWKVGSEGDVGAYWGLWKSDERFKF
ncbi:MAG: glycosyl hydrolase family 17 protein [Flavobacteriaceae bacterium]|nr:glycosyl hydrolase family 17 protein [Flavobacteriaceae bacterium]